MKRYEMTKTFAVHCTAIIEAENEQKARELFENVEVDNCFQESESASTWFCEETDIKDEDHDLPVIVKTETGYTVKS